MSTNWLGRLCGTIWTGVCERLAGCHWQISKMLCNLLLAPILSSSVGGVGFTPRCYAMNKAFVIFSAAEFYPQPSSAGLIVNILIFPAAVSVPTVFKRGGQMEMDSSIFSCVHIHAKCSSLHHSGFVPCLHLLGILHQSADGGWWC